jgi:hypothetical protein
MKNIDKFIRDEASKLDGLSRYEIEETSPTGLYRLSEAFGKILSEDPDGYYKKPV